MFFTHTNSSPDFKKNYDTIDWGPKTTPAGEHEWRAFTLRSKLRHCVKCGIELLKGETQNAPACSAECPSPHTPNAETAKALEETGGAHFETTDDLLEDLNG